MYGLLEVLTSVHGAGIIPRDIKPLNILYDIETGGGRLVDFGLSSMIGPRLGPAPILQWVEAPDARTVAQHLEKPEEWKDRPVVGQRVGTPGFRAPDVLMAAARQGPGLDVWSAGAILLCLLTRRYPDFRADKECVELAQWALILGSDRMDRAAMECERIVRRPRGSRGPPLEQIVLGLYPPFIAEPVEERDAVIDVMGSCWNRCRRGGRRRSCCNTPSSRSAATARVLGTHRGSRAAW
jgi:serine/threonine protein kinase